MYPIHGKLLVSSSSRITLYLAGLRRQYKKGALIYCDTRHTTKFHSFATQKTSYRRGLPQIRNSYLLPRHGFQAESFSCTISQLPYNCWAVEGRYCGSDEPPRYFSSFQSIVNPCNTIRRRVHSGSASFAAQELTKEPVKEAVPAKKQSKKPSSKVEETVNVLTDKIKEKEVGVVAPQPKRPLWKRVQDEILHYYHGFRLLFVDMKIAADLIWRILNGKSLSRREHKQLLRTTSDVFRLVPFSVFIIVPFMELLLPVFLKFFPGMLPSTFQTKSDRESKMKAELKVKLDMAKFLQETLDVMAPQANGRSSQTAKEFSEFISKIRETGSEVSNEEIMKYSKLFEDEITLDSLSRPLLIALCRVLEIPAIGTNALLRFQLRLRLRNLAADDQMIEKEGIDHLTYNELQAACKSRGMRAVGVTEERLKTQLNQWLQLSLHEKVPPSLLLLSRAMYLSDTLPPSALLQATLSKLPDSAALQTKAAIGEREGKVDNKTRIELLKEEERLIKEERQEAKNKEIEDEEKKVLAEAKPITASKTEEREILEPGSVTASHTVAPLVSELGPESYHPVDDQNTVLGAINFLLSRKMELGAEDKISSKDFEVIEGALDQLGTQSMILEKEELQDLKEEMADYKEDLEALADIIQDTGTQKVRVNKGAQRLFKKLNKMISELEKTVDVSQMATDKKSAVPTAELVAAMRQIKGVEGDPKKVENIARLLAKLDENKDGHIEVDDLLKVIEIVGRENTNMTTKQLEEILSMLAKEEILIVQKKAEKPSVQ